MKKDKYNFDTRKHFRYDEDGRAHCTYFVKRWLARCDKAEGK